MRCASFKQANGIRGGIILTLQTTIRPETGTSSSHLEGRQLLSCRRLVLFREENPHHPHPQINSS